MAKEYAANLRAFQEKLRDIIKDRAQADGVEVAEVVIGMHRDIRRYAATGIYILSPRNDLEPAQSSRDLDRWDVPVLCMAYAYTAEDQQTMVEDLVGVVVDVCKQHQPRFGNTVNNGYCRGVENAEVELGAEVRVAQQVVVFAEKER